VCQSESLVDENAALKDGLEKYRPYLNLLARANLGDALKNRVEASDIVQLTLLDAHRDQEKFEGDHELQYRAWLKKILMHRILEQARYWKAQKRDVARDVDLQRHVQDSFQRVDDWLEASQTSPSMIAHGNDMELKLCAAVEQLPDDLREVVVMHHFEGLKLVEIAAKIDCDQTTVGRRLFRGLKKLTELVKE